MPGDLPDRPRVLIVEDHDLLSQTVALAMRAEGFDVAVVRPTSDSQLAAAVDHHRPEVILLDLDLGPGIRAGEELIPDLVGVQTRVLVVTGTEDVTRISLALDRGADGFVHKASGLEALMDAVLRLARGERATEPNDLMRLRQQVTAQHEEHRHRLIVFDRLSARERHVLARLMEGDSVDAIASDSVVSVATVRSQVRGFLTMLGVNSQLAAVALAHRLGWCQGG